MESDLEFQIEERKQPEEQESKTEELEEREAGELAVQGVELSAEKVGSLNKDVTGILESETTTLEEKSRAKEILRKALDAFSDFYSKVKRVAKTLPFLLVLSGENQKPIQIEDGQVDKVESSSQNPYEALPIQAKFVDWLMSGKISEVYNDFVHFYNSRVDGKMTPEEIQFREKIAQNVQPIGYDPVGAADNLKSFENNDKRFSAKNLKNKSEQMRIREDLFRKYLGLKPYENYLIESPYQPTDARDPRAKYTSFSEKELVKAIQWRGEQSDFKTFNDLEKYVQKNNRFPGNKFLIQLGRYKTGMGYDSVRKEKYVSYYDIWDIDPPLLKKMHIDIDKFNFPYEVYGRVYESDFKN
ncbi:MAG: hypothetical protein ACYC5G_01895 [Candidatus Doudnabacteria bacterium]